MKKTPHEQIERAARMYRTSKAASTALGITIQAFTRLCRQHGIDTPRNRRARAA